MIASLGMYPFAHLREAYDRLWQAVHQRLPGSPEALAHDIDLHSAWHHPDLLVGQTCGWPLVTELAEVVVIGAFDVRVPFAAGGRYRSVIIGNKPVAMGLQNLAAVNGFGSLSGWVSLCHALGGAPVRVVETGAHAESVRAVAEGRAEVASIDSMSFEFLADSQPALVGRVHVIGHGPVVGSLPLVTAPAHADRLADLQAAFSGAVADPALASALEVLRIRGFVPFDRSDYLPLLQIRPPSRH
ncbi:MAG: phosphate/phosphite/phosphonate ABC transporter substrate-binding protein [Actinomycetota bacterium]